MAGDPAIAAMLIGCALTQAPAIALETPLLRVRDVVSLDCLSEARRRRVEDLAIALIEANDARVLSRQALANLVRRRAPELHAVTFSGAREEMVRIEGPRIDDARPGEAAQGSCFAAAAPIAEGAAIAAADLERAPCLAPVRTSVRYDRLNGIMRATRDIARGDALGPLPPAPVAIAERGEAMSLVTRMGPVMIERSVETVQPSRGGSVFVRDRDGHVFAAPLAEARTP